MPDAFATCRARASPSETTWTGASKRASVASISWGEKPGPSRAPRQVERAPAPLAGAALTEGSLDLVEVLLPVLGAEQIDRAARPGVRGSTEPEFDAGELGYSYERRGRCSRQESGTAARPGRDIVLQANIRVSPG